MFFTLDETVSIPSKIYLINQFSMSISRQNLTIVIVTLKSEHIIDECIQSIDSDISIIIVENSSNQNFKNYIEKKYKNVSCILVNENIGMGSGNNIGISKSKTDFVMILNPDVLLFEDTIDKLINAANVLENFTILAPISDNLDFPNYKINSNNNDHGEVFEVDSVDGYSMLINRSRINSISNITKDGKFFDENIFMYLENDDLCKRVKDNKEKIFIVSNSKIKHYGAKAVSEKFYNEIELSRNWHWPWSKFYFSKKHKGYIYALIEGLPKFFSSIIKYLFYFIMNKKYKSKIYLNRSLGFFNAMIGKTSWYRPKID